MSVRILHMMCTALLVLSPHLFMQACSSAQQEDGDLEGENATAENTEGNQAAEENSANETANEGGDEENVATEEGEDFNEQTADTEGKVLEGNQTQSDLENIIAGQNADGSAPVDATAATTPVSDATTAPTSVPTVSAGPALPEQGSKMPYIVRVGDSLSSIAKLIYGSAERWSEMAELSSIKNPNLVKPGDVVYYQLGQETLAFATAYESAPRNEVTVQRGDTLAAIAQRVYGQQGDWKFVWRQNSNIDNPDRLEVGQTIHYLTPASLTAALNYAKSLTLAELLGNKTDNVQTTDNVEAPAQTIDQQQTSNATSSINGFELATGMFHVFAANFATAG